MFIEKDKLYIGAIALAIIVAGVLYTTFSVGNTTGYLMEASPILIETPPFTFSEEQAPEAEYQGPAYIMVFISGEVANPGVFQVSSNARLVEVVDLAGGTTPYADINRINLASFLSDAQHIVVPAFGEAEIFQGPYVGTALLATQDTRININTADLTALTTLPGIGPVIGQNIITHRENNGPFSTIYELQNVTRIGPAIFANIQGSIKVE